MKIHFDNNTNKVEVADDADEVWDLLNRHVTLRDANRDLMAQVTTGEDAIEGLRSELQVLRRRLLLRSTRGYVGWLLQESKRNDCRLCSSLVYLQVYVAVSSDLFCA